MIYLLIALSLLFGLLRGWKEGAIHIMPYDANFVARFSCKGVRCHRWHKYYHAISVAKMAVFAVLCIMVWEARPSWTFILGLLILLWESFEVAYSYSRTGKVTGDTELIIFVDMFRYRLHGWKVWAIHGFRIVTCIALLITGGFS